MPLAHEKRKRRASTMLFVETKQIKVEDPKIEREDPKINLRKKIIGVIHSQRKKEGNDLNKEKNEDEREDSAIIVIGSALKEKKEDEVSEGEAPIEGSAVFEIGSATHKEFLRLLKKEFDAKFRFLWLDGKLFITLDTGGPHEAALGEFAGQLRNLTIGHVAYCGTANVVAPAGRGAPPFNSQPDCSWRPRTIVGANRMPTMVLEVNIICLISCFDII